MSDVIISEEDLREFNERLKAAGQTLDDPAIRVLVNEQVEALMKNGSGFVRKMRFGTGEGDNQLAGSKFGRWRLTRGDVEMLYDITTAAHNFQPHKFPGPSEELRNAFDAIQEACYYSPEEIREIDKKAIDGVFSRVPKAEFFGNDRAMAERGAWQETQAYQRALRALDSAESGYGSQLIGAQYVQELWDAAREESMVFDMLRSVEMTDPTMYIPVAADLPEMLFVSESTSPNSADYATSKTGSNRVQVDAKKFVIHQVWSDELEEDSIIALIPMIREQAISSIAFYSDSVVVNGDTTNADTGNINLDDANPVDTNHYLAVDGMRHVGLVDNTNNQLNMGGAITWDALRGTRVRMIDTTNLQNWGQPKMISDLIQVCDPETGHKISNLDEVINWRTNNNRPLLPGQIAEVSGNPVINTMVVGKTEADGKISTTSGNNTKGQLLTFNKRGFVVGWRRRVVTEIERSIRTGQTVLVHSLRYGFGRYSATGAASGIEAADVIFNITV